MEGRVVSVLSIFEETRKRQLFAHSAGTCQLPVLGLVIRAKHIGQGDLKRTGSRIQPIQTTQFRCQDSLGVFSDTTGIMFYDMCIIRRVPVQGARICFTICLFISPDSGL